MRTLAFASAFVALSVAGLALPLLPAPVAVAAPLATPGPGLPIATAFLGAMIAALWTYDGWYALASSAGELRAPARDLPRALMLGVASVIAIYLLLNLVYLRTIPIEVLAHTTRVAEAAAGRVMGATGARVVAAAVMVSALGCLSATILYASRIYHPMAEDRLFFRSVARIDPHWRTPVTSLWLQCGWAMVLALSGSYTQLFTYVTFQGVLMHLLAGLAVFRLRRTQPALERPYRAWGYPEVPALFVAGMLLLTVNTLLVAPRESLLGLAVLVAGLPFYAAWRRAGRANTALRGIRSCDPDRGWRERRGWRACWPRWARARGGPNPIRCWPSTHSARRRSPRCAIRRRNATS